MKPIEDQAVIGPGVNEQKVWCRPQFSRRKAVSAENNFTTGSDGLYTS